MVLVQFAMLPISETVPKITKTALPTQLTYPLESVVKAKVPVWLTTFTWLIMFLKNTLYAKLAEIAVSKLGY